MKLAEIESLQYKGSVELSGEDRRYTVDIFYDPGSKAVYQIIRELSKWRMIAQGAEVSKAFVPDEWTDLS
ncbi:MAG: hypothetical protein HRU19_22630 [Pseudobacteriovorax sp.]|nr:hypothetical protein [Pseudobacteriovorax sp.]